MRGVGLNRLGRVIHQVLTLLDQVTKVAVLHQTTIHVTPESLPMLLHYNL